MDELLELALVPITNARTRTLGGREYVVVDAVILQQQVLEGSDGPLFYPLDEINQDIGVWNGYPLTARHPIGMVGGKLVPVSARQPEVAEVYQVGNVYNDRMVGEQRMVECWFDVHNSNRIDRRIIPLVKSGKAVNVSTGIFTGKVVVNGEHNGRRYEGSVKGIKPDHLAVLVDEKGACSVQDGCGINVNSMKPQYPEACPYCKTKLEIDPDSGVCNRCGKKVAPVTNSQPVKEPPNVNKEQLVAFLVANCSCWKDKTTTLNTLDEESLKTLKANHEKAKEGEAATAKLALTTNSLKELGLGEDPTKVKDVVTNMTPDECKAWADKQSKKTTMNSNGPVTKEVILNALKGLTDAEYLDLAPPGARQVLNAAAEVDLQERVKIVKQLTANIQDPVKKQEQATKLKDKTLPQLREILEFAGLNNSSPSNPTSSDRFMSLFLGQGDATKPAPTTNRKDVLLPSPSLNSSSGEVVETVFE